MADIDAIAHLDFEAVRCQCEQKACKTAGGCANQATEKVEFHALNHCNELPGEINPFGNYVLLLCMSCVESLAIVVSMHLARFNRVGRHACSTCGAPAVDLSDLIREVTTL